MEENNNNKRKRKRKRVGEEDGEKSGKQRRG